MPLGDNPQKLNHDNSGFSPLTKVLAALVSAALLVTGFVFSLLIFLIVAVIGLTVWGYLWWKTRALRRHLNEQMEQMQREQQRGSTQGEPMTEGVIIEGEVIRETTPPRQ